MYKSCGYVKLVIVIAPLLIISITFTVSSDAYKVTSKFTVAPGTPGLIAPIVNTILSVASLSKKLVIVTKSLHSYVEQSDMQEMGNCVSDVDLFASPLLIVQVSSSHL